MIQWNSGRLKMGKTWAHIIIVFGTTQYLGLKSFGKTR
jgi:hypothetical protein